MSPFMRMLQDLRAHTSRVHGHEPRRFSFAYEPAEETKKLWCLSFHYNDETPPLVFFDDTGEGAVRRACEHYERQPSKSP